MECTGRGARTCSAGLLGLMLATAALLAILLLDGQPARAQAESGSETGSNQPLDSGVGLEGDAGDNLEGGLDNSEPDAAPLTEPEVETFQAAEQDANQLLQDMDQPPDPMILAQRSDARSESDRTGDGSPAGQGTDITPDWAKVALQEQQTPNGRPALGQDDPQGDDPQPNLAQRPAAEAETSAPAADPGSQPNPAAGAEREESINWLVQTGGISRERAVAAADAWDASDKALRDAAFKARVNAGTARQWVEAAGKLRGEPPFEPPDQLSGHPDTDLYWATWQGYKAVGRLRESADGFAASASLGFPVQEQADGARAAMLAAGAATEKAQVAAFLDLVGASQPAQEAARSAAEGFLAAAEASARVYHPRDYLDNPPENWLKDHPRGSWGSISERLVRPARDSAEDATRYLADAVTAAAPRSAARLSAEAVFNQLPRRPPGLPLHPGTRWP
jgi:hypothetical protein